MRPCRPVWNYPNGRNSPAISPHMPFAFWKPERFKPADVVVINLSVVVIRTWPPTSIILNCKAT